MSDYILADIVKNHGTPEFLFVDTRPAQYPLAIITTHEIAEQVSRSTKQQPYSTTKSPTIQSGFGRLVGRYSLLSEEGEAWKSLRKRFNPGFAPQHLLSLLPVVVDKTSIFMEKLDAVSVGLRTWNDVSTDIVY
jgi:cytochrome P450